MLSYGMYRDTRTATCVSFMATKVLVIQRHGLSLAYPYTRLGVYGHSNSVRGNEITRFTQNRLCCCSLAHRVYEHNNRW